MYLICDFKTWYLFKKNKTLSSKQAKIYFIDVAQRNPHFSKYFQ